MRQRQVSVSDNKIVRRKAALVSLNSAATDVAAFTGLSSKWRVRKMTVFDASTSLAISLATIGLYSGPGATGSAIAALALVTGLTGAAKTVDMTLASIAGSDCQTGSAIYVRCGVAHGSAATVTVVLEIEDLT